MIYYGGRILVPTTATRVAPLKVTFDLGAPILDMVNVVILDSSAALEKCGYRVEDKEGVIYPADGSSEGQTFATGQKPYAPIPLVTGGLRLTGMEKRVASNPYRVTVLLYNEDTGAHNVFIQLGALPTVLPSLTPELVGEAVDAAVIKAFRDILEHGKP